MADTLFGHAGAACRSNLADARKAAKQAGVNVKGLWIYKSNMFKRDGEQPIAVYDAKGSIVSQSDTCLRRAGENTLPQPFGIHGPEK